jgi:hypothetical protein
LFLFWPQKQGFEQKVILTFIFKLYQFCQGWSMKNALLYKYFVQQNLAKI